jgi:hypothetical protein
LKNILKYAIKVFCLLLGKRNYIPFLEQLLLMMQSSSDNFITYTLRPKKISLRKSIDKLDPKLPLLAIVIQGPIITKDEFTSETIKLYKQNFPKAIIISST